MLGNIVLPLSPDARTTSHVFFALIFLFSAISHEYDLRLAIICLHGGFCGITCLYFVLLWNNSLVFLVLRDDLLSWLRLGRDKKVILFIADCRHTTKLVQPRKTTPPEHTSTSTTCIVLLLYRTYKTIHRGTTTSQASRDNKLA